MNDAFTVLSVDEVRSLFAHIKTFHNYAYLATVYSCGLRLHEGLHLKVSDIDSSRMMIHVHRGKGTRIATSRCPNPSPSLAPLLGDPPPPTATWDTSLRQTEYSFDSGHALYMKAIHGGKAKMIKSTLTRSLYFCAEVCSGWPMFIRLRCERAGPTSPPHVSMRKRAELLAHV